MNPIEIYRYDSWCSFKSDIISELFTDGIFQEGKYLFRGHSSSDWQLTSSYDRHNFPIDKFSKLIEMFKSECEWLHVDKTVMNNEKYFIAFSQHHGIPTRLLDWTYSPYIASFFAFSDVVLVDESTDKIAVWILNTESGIWTHELGVEIINIPSVGNLRIRNQNGCFTLSCTQHRTLENYVKNVSEKCSGWALRQCILPSTEYLKAIPDLNSMGINWSKIYPGIEGCVASSLLNWRCQNLNQG